MSAPAYRYSRRDRSLRNRLGLIALLAAGFIALVFALSMRPALDAASSAGEQLRQSGSWEAPLGAAKEHPPGHDPEAHAKEAIFAEMDALRGADSLADFWRSLRDARVAAVRHSAMQVQLGERVRDLEERLARSEETLKHSTGQAQQLTKTSEESRKQLEAAIDAERRMAEDAKRLRQTLAEAEARLEAARESERREAGASERLKGELAEVRSSLVAARDAAKQATESAERHGRAVAEQAAALEAARARERREAAASEGLKGELAEVRASLAAARDAAKKAAESAERQERTAAEQTAALEAARARERHAVERLERQSETVTHLASQLKAGMERETQAVARIDRLTAVVAQMRAEFEAERAERAGRTAEPDKQHSAPLRAMPESEPRAREGRCPPSVRLKMSDNLQFASGEIRPAKALEAKLSATVVPRILDLMQEYGADIVEVVGHTDPAPVRHRHSNLDRLLIRYLSEPSQDHSLRVADNAGLGMARAAAVARVLSKDDRLKAAAVIPLSAAQIRTAEPADGEQRRRIEVRLRRAEHWIEIE